MICGWRHCYYPQLGRAMLAASLGFSVALCKQEVAVHLCRIPLVLWVSFNSKARENRAAHLVYCTSSLGNGWDFSILRTDDRCATTKYCCELLLIPVSGLDAGVLFSLGSCEFDKPIVPVARAGSLDHSSTFGTLFAALIYLFPCRHLM